MMSQLFSEQVNKAHTKIQQTKGQLISKADCQAEASSKKRTNEFVFTSI